MISCLQSLRGFFAIMVFLSHFAINDVGDRVFYDGGTMGVEFFMMLSGFVLCAAYYTRVKEHKINYKRFELKRLIRIYPLHLACLMAWAVVNVGFAKYDFATCVIDAILLQAWLPDPSIFYSYNIPAWYLSALLFFYALFPVLIAVAVRHPKTFYSLYFIAIICYVVFLLFGVDSLSSDMILWATRIFPVTRLLDFVAGVLLWHIYSAISNGNLVKRLRSSCFLIKTVVEFLPVVLYFVAVIVADGVSLAWKSQAVWWLPTMCCILVYSLLDKCGGLLSKLLDCKWLVAFGNASFAFYLLHVAMIGAVGRVLHFVGIDMDVMWRLSLTLSLAIVASLIVTKYFDEPVGRKLKSYFRLSSAK